METSNEQVLFEINKVWVDNTSNFQRITKENPLLASAIADTFKFLNKKFGNPQFEISAKPLDEEITIPIQEQEREEVVVVPPSTNRKERKPTTKSTTPSASKLKKIAALEKEKENLISLINDGVLEDDQDTKDFLRDLDNQIDKLKN